MSDLKAIKTLFKNEIIKSTKKVKGKKSAIAEIVENTIVTLPVKSIYDMSDKIKHFYFITVKNYSKQPKFRHFLAISLANNSSDLLVQLSKEYAIKNELKLIQYSIYPKTLRTQLLSMKEIESTKDFNDSIEILKTIRNEFREKLSKLRKLIENE